MSGPYKNETLAFETIICVATCSTPDNDNYKRKRAAHLISLENK